MAKALKSAAILTIRKPGKMSKSGRKAIAEWLRCNASYFVRHGERYSETRFTSRYMY